MTSIYTPDEASVLKTADEAARKIIIITAPSGAGKTSITHYLLRSIPQLQFSISATTRSPRANEINGKDYYFISESDFHSKIQHNQFVEWEMVYEGKYYGTLRTELERLWQQGQFPLLDIDVKGAIHVQEEYAQNSLSLFINPPSVPELEKRLRSRGTESEESLQTRISKAEYELSFAQHFDRIIINNDLREACQEAEKAVKNFLNIPA